MKPGTLYIVATPIGNLGDITLRAVEVLAAVDFVAAENMGKTKALLSHLGLGKKVVSYREENRRKSAASIVRELKQGRSGALVTDAGTPGISDPGHYLVGVCAGEDLPVVPVPGVSALGAALSASGLALERFVFEGFLPSRSAARRRRLKELAAAGYPLVLYESPRRVPATLRDILEVLGDRSIVLAREMTKVYEEFVRGRTSEVLGKVEGGEVKGEVTILVEGGQAPGEPPEVTEAVKALRAEGLSASRVASILSGLTGVNRRDIYRLAGEFEAGYAREEGKRRRGEKGKG